MVEEAACHEVYYTYDEGEFYKYEIFEDYYDEDGLHGDKIILYMLDGTTIETDLYDIIGQRPYIQTKPIGELHGYEEQLWCIGDDE